MKDGIRVLGMDDAAFNFEDNSTFLTGVVYRGTEFIEDIVTADIEVDGWNATDKVMEIYNSCNNPRQIKAVLIDGISFGGFNIVDIEEVAQETGKPVIAVTSNRPDREKFREIMEKTNNTDQKFEKLDEPEEIELKDGTVFVQFAGTDIDSARQVIKKSTIHGLTPEPIRVAHMIGRALKENSIA